MAIGVAVRELPDHTPEAHTFDFIGINKKFASSVSWRGLADRRLRGLARLEGAISNLLNTANRRARKGFYSPER